MNTQNTLQTKGAQSPATATKPGALARMAAMMSVEPAKLYSTLKATVFRNATDDELLALVVVANEYDLNPLLKEIYAFPAKGGGIVPVVSVDGWNKMLMRQKDFDGIEFEMEDDGQGNPYSCTATIYIKSRSRPVKITEYFAECVRKTEPWTNMPRRMLRNRTLCQASRVAFGFAGIHDEDEAKDIMVEATVMPPKKVNLVADKSQGRESAPTQGATQEPEQPTDTRNTSTLIGDAIIEAGYTFDDFKNANVAMKWTKDAEAMGGFDDMTEEDAKRLYTPAGMKTMLLKIKHLKG